MPTWRECKRPGARCIARRGHSRRRRFAVVADPQHAIFILFQGLPGMQAPATPPAGRALPAGTSCMPRLGKRVRFLFRPVRLAQGPGRRHGSNGHVSAVRGQRPRNWRDDDQYRAIARPILALLLERCEHRFGRDSRDRERGIGAQRPHQVPGGSWIVQCSDPQGAMFALVAAKR